MKKKEKTVCQIIRFQGKIEAFFVSIDEFAISSQQAFRPEEGPSRGLLLDYKPSCGPSFEALALITNCSQNIVICCHVATTQLLEINLTVTVTDFLTDAVAVA